MQTSLVFAFYQYRQISLMSIIWKIYRFFITSSKCVADKINKDVLDDAELLLKSHFQSNDTIFNGKLAVYVLNGDLRQIVQWALMLSLPFLPVKAALKVTNSWKQASRIFFTVSQAMLLSNGKLDSLFRQWQCDVIGLSVCYVWCM